MYKNILQKCLDELNKEPFKIDKVIGMLETLIEMDPTPTSIQPVMNNIYPTRNVLDVNKINKTLAPVEEDEEFNETAAKYVGGTIGKIG